MLLEVADLTIAGKSASIVRSLSVNLSEGDTLGIVGESGSGKTMSALALIGLLPDAMVATGAIRFDGDDLLRLSEARMQRLRGNSIAMIFQEPLSALNPLQTIGHQIAEPPRLHRGLSRSEGAARAVELLASVALPPRITAAYPHALSGGQRQRALIAMALSCAPRLIIADEPTTALDVTVQAHILQLLASLQAQHGMALIVISHDLAIIAQQCRNVLVMYGGMVMESGQVADVLAHPAHPYTIALMRSRPRIRASPHGRLSAISGAPPTPGAMPRGCPFAPRCPHAIAPCSVAPPAPVQLANGRQVRCIRVDSTGRLA